MSEIKEESFVKPVMEGDRLGEVVYDRISTLFGKNSPLFLIPFVRLDHTAEASESFLLIQKLMVDIMGESQTH